MLLLLLLFLINLSRNKRKHINIYK